MLLESQAWSNANTIAKKFAVGTTTTAQYQERISTFLKMNDKAESVGPILPQANIVGKKEQAGNDRFNRRVVKQLNDISFEEDSDDYEEIKNLKRQPKTILNEEHLKEYLDKTTMKLDLENHYWLKNSFIDKLGRMAPNLRVLSLRRMKFIDNVTFAEIFKHLEKLIRIDLMDCEGLYTSAAQLMVQKNPKLAEIQLSGCFNAVDDQLLMHIAGLHNTLTYLDISYANKVTDEGLKHFEPNQYEVSSLIMNDLKGISSAGLSIMIGCCADSLMELEAALMPQAEMKGDFFVNLARCSNLEYLDLTGSTNIDDMAF